MESVATYFIIFKPQAGQTEPSYSYVSSSELEMLKKQDVVLAVYEISDPQYNKEEVDYYLEQFKTMQGIVGEAKQ